MVRILFVTGSAGGVGIGNLQHRGALRKSNGGFRIVLNSSLMRSVTMTPPSDDLHNVLLANRPDAIPDKNNITVQGILEKTQSEAASSMDGLQAYLTDAVIGALGEFVRNSNAT
jgi:hypothetical protein